MNVIKGKIHAVTLTRLISDAEKIIILERFGKVCYAIGHDINDESDIQYDHIKAYADKGASDIDNIAPRKTVSQEKRCQVLQCNI